MEYYAYNSSTGNLESKAGVSYTYGDANHDHAVTMMGSNSYSYDANGNQVTRTVGYISSILSYDAENRLVSVSGAASATFVYDGDGNRVKGIVGGTTTTYIGDYFEWVSSTSNMKKYYYASGVRVAMRTGTSNPLWLLGDHLGSTSKVVNYNGLTEQSQQMYKPWGEKRYPTGAPTLPTTFRYTGQRSETGLGPAGGEGLYFYNARWYDSQLGRFTQPDTVIPEQQGVQAWDRYAYVNNSPINYTDSSGYWLETLWDIGSVIVDVVDIAQNGLTWENAAALVIDVASVILPVVPAVGSVIVKAGRAANTIDNALDATKTADDIIDAGKSLDKASDLSHADEVVEATGQLHHVFSDKIMDALNKHDTLRGFFSRDDFIVQARDAASHNGYQAWHRAYDNEIVEWLTTNKKATPEGFLEYMLDLYKQTDMQDKFPDAYKLIEMGLEEMK